MLPPIQTAASPAKQMPLNYAAMAIALRYIKIQLPLFPILNSV